MRVEGEHGHVPEAARLFAVHFRADGLGRVLNENQAALPAEGRYGGHVRHIAVEMDHHHGPGFGGQNFFDALGRDHAGVRVHIGPDQARALFKIGIG